MSHDHGLADFSDAHGAGAARDRIDRMLRGLVDAGLVGAVAVVPFLMGGRQAFGQLALVTLAAAAATAWVLRQSLRSQGTWRWCAGDLVLLGGIVLVVVQLAPLPAPVRDRLSPHTAELLPLWNAPGGAPGPLGTWSQISLAPRATEDGLAILLAYALLFVTAVQRVRCVEDVEWMLRWCAGAAVLMAALGLVQLVAGNGKFFWIYEHPYTSTAEVAKGAFTNRNHFAHFLALGIGPLVWWIQHGLSRSNSRRSRSRETSGSRQDARVLTNSATSLIGGAPNLKPPKAGKSEGRRRHSFGHGARRPWPGLGSAYRIVALGVLLFAGLLSLSRGGMVVMLLAGAISVGVCWRASSLGRRLVGGLALTAALTVAGLFIFGYDRVAARVDNLASGSVERWDPGAGRRAIWRAAIQALPHYLVLGSGVGTFQHVSPMYLESQDDSLVYTHAENGPLQVALETGLPGLALVGAGAGLCLFWCVSNLRRAPSARSLVCAGAVTAALAANLVHSLFDFVWYVPGCMAVVALMAACAFRLRQMAAGTDVDRAGQFRLPRPVGLVATLAVAVLGLWMVLGRVNATVAEPNWFAYLLAARMPAEPSLAPPEVPDAPQAGLHEHAPPEPEGRERKMIAALEEVLRRDPNHAEAHLRLAELEMALFDQLQQQAANAMPLCALSEAAAQAGFDPPQARQWLARAAGEHWTHLEIALYHARRGLALCPLAGEGYLYLAELAFLDEAPNGGRPALIQQALRVRPTSGRVMFHVGREALLAGRLDQGIRFWRRAFHAGKTYQAQIIQRLAGRLRPDNLEADVQLMLETFQPDLYGLRILNAVYANRTTDDHLIALRRPYAQAAEAEAANATGSAAADLWLEAMLAHCGLQEDDRALACGRKGLLCAPNHFRLHYHLAKCLAARQEFAEAEEHARWCQQRKPESRPVQRLLREVVIARLDREHAPSVASRRPEDVR